MATVGVDLATYVSKKPERYARIVSGSVVVTLPWWPSSISRGGLSPTWTQLPRAGKVPLLVRDTLNLPTVTLDFLVTAPGERQRINPDISAWPVMKPLLAFAAKGTIVYLVLGEAGYKVPWRITDITYDEDDWSLSGTVSRALVSMTLTRASDASMPRGPVPPRKVKP